MLMAPILMKPLDETKSFKPRPVTGPDVALFQEWLQHAGLRGIARDTVYQAIIVRAEENSFHPVKDYLNGLQWDGTARVKTWLTTYLGVQQTPYSEAVGPMFLISMVARILRGRCKVDYVPIIEGEQGELKSTACSILAGEYFSDHLPDISQKDASQHLCGKWLIEISELHTMNRAEITQLKAFITREVERYRPPWGRFEVHQARQCVFVGTTNKDAYLKDETGNRRFWPLIAGTIDTDALKLDRDQLFAEAVLLFHDGVPWWPNRNFERNVIRPEQDARYEHDAWEEKVAEYLEGKDRVTVNQVASMAIGLEIHRTSSGDTRRIGSILQHLQWCKARTGQTRWWRPKGR
jgi:predicted P-loop ATPase